MATKKTTSNKNTKTPTSNKSERNESSDTITINKSDLERYKSHVQSYYKSKYRGYSAANVGRTHSDMPISSESSYSEIKKAYKILVARSKDAFNNNPYARAIFNIFTSNIVCEGIKPTPRVKTSSGEDATEINEQLSNEFAQFNDYADITGKSTFYEMQIQAFNSIIASGGNFVNVVTDNKFDYLPIRLQQFSQDYLDFTKDNYDPDKKTTNKILHGIELDKYLRPQNYYFDSKYSAANIIHTYRRSLPDQLIGVPWLSPVLPCLHDISTLVEDNVVSSKIQSAIIYWIKKNCDETLPDMADLDEDENLIIEPGTFIRTIDKPEPVQVNDVTSKTLEPLINIILHSTSVAMGFSYGLLTRDLNNSNFSASRANIAEDRRYFMTLIKWFSKEYCHKVWEQFVKHTIMAGKIKGVSYSDYNKNKWAFHQCSWATNSWEYVNPLQDVQAYKIMLESGMMTEDQYWREVWGIDFKSAIQQQKHEQDFKSNIGLKANEVK